MFVYEFQVLWKNPKTLQVWMKLGLIMGSERCGIEYGKTQVVF